jgi:hypothetical protein
MCDILHLCIYIYKRKKVQVVKRISLFCTRPEVCLPVCYNNPACELIQI